MNTDTGWKSGLLELVADWEKLDPYCREFPRNTEKFETLLIEAGRYNNVTTLRPCSFWKLIKRVDGRYPKIGLVQCLNHLLEALKRIPTEPQHQLTIAAESAGGWKADALRQADDLLNRFSLNHRPSNVDWDTLFRAVQPFTSPAFKIALEKPAVQQELDYDEELKPLMPFLGWVALLDIYQQVQEWWAQYQNAHHFAVWICMLGNPGYCKWLSQKFPALILMDYEAMKQEWNSPARRKKRYRRERKLMAKGLLTQNKGQERGQGPT